MRYILRGIHSFNSALTTIFMNAICYKVAAASRVALQTNIDLTILMVLTVAGFSAQIREAVHPRYSTFPEQSLIYCCSQVNNLQATRLYLLYFSPNGSALSSTFSKQLSKIL
ncbi:hypothetical protein M422DRAFT_264031 [Sphaerobolus stellatus SS14]|uniref:Uncharacterized protein n=1 Tax=Sphaerobolus stellatus (strain SS14) TaxID=990650 RepID=A0A0C9UGL8_SPHS4|nr:hypothetical protein M422DRAFT_264031 [Sphaerobolus stellatus SS14]